MEGSNQGIKVNKKNLFVVGLIIVLGSVYLEIKEEAFLL